jgi:hypothetical protein
MPLDKRTTSPRSYATAAIGPSPQKLHRGLISAFRVLRKWPEFIMEGRSDSRSPSRECQSSSDGHANVGPMAPMVPPAQFRSGARRRWRHPIPARLLPGQPEAARARAHEMGESRCGPATASLRIDEGPHWLRQVRRLDRCGGLRGQERGPPAKGGGYEKLGAFRNCT